MQVFKIKMDEATKTLELVDVFPRYTNVNFFQSAIIAVIGGTATLLVTLLLKGVLPYVYSLIHERGIIQYVTIYCFWFAVGMLITKWIKVKKEISAFELPYVKDFTKGKDVVGMKTITSEHLRLQINLDPQQSRLILINRINKSLKQLMVSGNPAQVSQVLSTVSANDSAIIDASYIPIKFLIWLIPILGFVGTVMGMSYAIGSFNSVLQGIKDVGFQGLQTGLTKVTSGLGVAFDTTFLALILAVTVNLFANALQKKEEDFLSDVENFVTENIVNKLRVQDISQKIGEIQSYDKVTNAIERLVNEMNSVTRELKNLGLQNQVNAQQLQQQMGRLIEAFQSSAYRSDETIPFMEHEHINALREFTDALKENGKSLKAMAQLAELIQANTEILKSLKAPIEEMTMVNRKLGELYSKIYKTTFISKEGEK